MKVYVRKEITTAEQPADGRRRPRSEETKAKLRAALAGRKLSPEWIAKRSASRIKNAKPRSPEYLESLRQRMKGKCGFPREAILRSAEKRRGKKLTPEHRAKLVEAWNKYPRDIMQAQREVTKLKKRINEKQNNGSS